MSYVRHRITVQNVNEDGALILVLNPSDVVTPWVSVAEIDSAIANLVTTLETNSDLTVDVTRYDETGTVL
jgi:hypothetical protein